MTRRLQVCQGCGGGTRHADRRCSGCRTHGTRVILLPSLPPSLNAQALREGINLTRFLDRRHPISWRGRGR